MRETKKLHWALAMAMECALLGLTAALFSLSEWLPVIISNVCLWAGYPLAAAVAAYFATRKGVNNYAAWIPGPVIFPLVYWLVWNYLPSAAPAFISALAAIVGAAAGETKNQFERRRQK